MINAFSLLFLFILVIGSMAVIGGLSLAIGRRELADTCRAPYECGLEQASAPRHPFAIKFFLTAALFVVFDVEVAFLFPWAVVFREMIAQGMGLLLLAELFVFLAVVGIGLAYVWRCGALEWED